MADDSNPPARPTRPPPQVPANDDRPQLAQLDLDSLPAPSRRPPIPTSSLLHPTLSSLPSLNASNADVLTPLRAHYLKKYLVNHQFMDELATLADPALTDADADADADSHGAGDAIAALGRPFIAGKDPKTGRERVLPDLPFVRFMFRQFVLTFPYVSAVAGFSLLHSLLLVC